MQISVQLSVRGQSGNFGTNGRASQIRWLEAELKKPSRWTLVVGHFPIFSLLGNGPTSELVAELLPILTRYRAHAYFSGHDHGLQHLRPRTSRADVVTRPDLFVSAGGGYHVHTELKPDADRSLNAAADSVFRRSVHGFAVVRITYDELKLKYIDVDGQEIHSAKILP